MHTAILRFLGDEDGSTSIEYALIAALMAIVSIGAARALSGNISNTWSSVETAITTATS